MQVHRDAKEATIDAMKPGDLFGFSLRNQFYLGLSIPPRNVGEGPGLIVLHPGHPDLSSEAPGILLASVIRNRPILHFPTSLVVPSTEVGDMHIGFETMDPAPGALIVADGQHLVSVVLDRNIRLFSVGDGSPYNEDAQNAIWYSSWQIMLPRDNGAHQPLCTVKAAV